MKIALQTNRQSKIERYKNIKVSPIITPVLEDLRDQMIHQIKMMILKLKFVEVKKNNWIPSKCQDLLKRIRARITHKCCPKVLQRHPNKSTPCG